MSPVLPIFHHCGSYQLKNKKYSFKIIAIFIFIVTMDDHCPYTIHRPNEDRSFKIKWTGSETFEKCKIGFKGGELSNYDKTFQVCVEAKEFHLQSTGIRLTYSVGKWQNGYKEIQKV